ncbi:nitrite reductase small subunit NirD [Arthrobacter sp. I2-34]|uniref:Nitrite reductase small subunit NirD n=1 Tax=Arthrobacter hankyongi TaxID=2904801 RepID=A0ABS9L1G9_9MICC|nr:nitrite reductase small subunit NirD [Arthrobacter hankyongi]MCG2620492.1 nitrite reductase small subunit NirD [Arthrobacter hankyongi]
MTVMISPETLSAVDGIQWHRVCQVDDLEPCWGEAALVAGRQLALFRISDSEVYAVDQRDPATGAYVMARGIVGSSGPRATIASPLHKEVYLLETGECLAGPEHYLPAYPVRIEDGAVVVGLAAARGGAA